MGIADAWFLIEGKPAAGVTATDFSCFLPLVSMMMPME